MSVALDVYDGAIASAADGGDAPLLLHISKSNVAEVGYADWCADHRAGDDELLDRCVGATLDVGCGPGRLVAALHQRGVRSLGIDISAEAVRQSRVRGALVIRGDVFLRIPAHGRWGTILLSDGNIGIGGNPRALLTRCQSLLGPNGIVLAELTAPDLRFAAARYRASAATFALRPVACSASRSRGQGLVQLTSDDWPILPRSKRPKSGPAPAAGSPS